MEKRLLKAKQKILSHMKKNPNVIDTLDFSDELELDINYEETLKILKELRTEGHLIDGEFYHIGHLWVHKKYNTWGS